MLRMNDLALKPVHAGEVGRVALIIIIIAGAHEKHIAADRHRLAVARALNDPAGVLA